jgi:Kef-type K+ transport system membrane component KefB
VLDYSRTTFNDDEFACEKFVLKHRRARYTLRTGNIYFGLLFCAFPMAPAKPLLIPAIALATACLAGVAHVNGGSNFLASATFGAALPPVHDPENQVLLLLVQVGVILGLSRLMGILFSRMRQPQVVGEMVAGIMLGPSLLGWLAPGLQGRLFPADSVILLNILSQIGIIFFLFLIGLELDPNLVRNRGKSTVVTALCSIAVPFVLGVSLTLALYHTRLFDDDPSGARRFAAALFLGAAMSVTAFPVLARILTERNLQKNHLGAMAIACAAVNDVAAWVMLAFVVGVAHAAGSGANAAIRTLALSLGYAAIVFLVIRPFLRRLELIYQRQGRLSQNVVAVIFLLVLGSAWATEAIGIHAMFGAFLIGCVMPKGTQFVRHVTEKLEDFTVVFLLPVFFAYAGLKTQIGLIDDPQLWSYAVLIIAAACTGKLLGTAIPAKLFGSDWREAAAMGVLMNTRGLMELVTLTVGLQLHVINNAVFAIMVLMALLTTFMTTPLLHWVYPAQRLLPPRKIGDTRSFSVLIPVADPRSGGPLLRIAEMLVGSSSDQGRIVALHLRRPDDRPEFRSGLAEPSADPLQPLLDHANKNNVRVEPISFVSSDVPHDIARVCRDTGVDLVLIGFHRPVFGKTILGGTVHRILSETPVDAAVFVDRGFLGAQRVLIPYLGSAHDRFALELGGRLAREAKAEITALHVVAPKRVAGDSLHATTAIDRVFNDPSQPAPVRVRVVESDYPVDAVLEASHDFDLIVIGVSEEWGLASQLFGWRSERIAEASSTSMLIVRKKPAEAEKAK